MAQINNALAFTEVTGDNIQSLIDPILNTIRQAQYIAVDTEFSGHCPTIAKHMDQRYRSIAEVVRTHTLFSFGLTVISATNASYEFTNLEFFTRNQQPFQVDPKNIKFLAENGLDFARTFEHGIPFTSGTVDQETNKTQVLRQLWYGILQIIKDQHIPIIVHNGLLDIMYLYQSFFATLPNNLSTFIEDLVEMFPAGIYDTKYVAVSVLGESKSFLAYLYCKYLRLASWHAQILPPLPSKNNNSNNSNNNNSLDDASPAMKRRKRNKKNEASKIAKEGICGPYAKNGWCKGGKGCMLSHDLDIILDYDLGIPRDERKKIDMESSSNKGQEQTNKDTDNSGLQRRDHSAHFDAYMTAFIFCHYLSTFPADKLPLHINKLNLMRLDIPLHLKQSQYAKPSTEWIRIKSQLWPTL